MKRIIFTVTNELNYDQRMIRICSSLAENGFQVLLIGRKTKTSSALSQRSFLQKRLPCFFSRGFLAYAEFNIRLFLCMLFEKHDVVCAIDLDTIMHCYFVSKIRGTLRVYDAHELFCEMKEISTRPFIYRFWKAVERDYVPHFPNGYTVNEPIAKEFEKMYRLKYGVIRNVPVLRREPIPVKHDRYILYQGAVNEGRGFETLIPAMKDVSLPLVVCGEGNFLSEAKKLTSHYRLEDKVIFRGQLKPEELRGVTRSAWLGITIFDDIGLSNYFSLANRFFDYMHAGVPQVCIDFPVYRSILSEHPFAELISDIKPETIAAAFNRLLNDTDRYHRLQQNCLLAREKLNWQNEEKMLIAFYNKLFKSFD